MRIFNFKPSRPDTRDFTFKLRAPIHLPPLADVIKKRLSPPLDQGDIGSCVGHALAQVTHVNLSAIGKRPFVPSRLAIYFEARALEGTVPDDAGCEIRNAVKAMVKTGAGRERTWPYVQKRFRDHPPEAYYKSAGKTPVTRYERVPHTLQNIKEAVARGYPVAFGFKVMNSFMGDDVARGAVMPTPVAGEGSQGWHAVVAIGYDDAKQAVQCRNSWGPDWGDKGNFWMPYQYIADTSLAADFWCFWND